MRQTGTSEDRPHAVELLRLLSFGNYRMKMEFALQPISENFNENGGYHGHFIKQKQLDTKAVLESDGREP